MLNLKKTDKMKNFDFRRCGLLLKRDLLGNRKWHLRLLIGAFIACFIVELLSFYKASVYGRTLAVRPGDARPLLMEQASAAFLLLFLFLYVAMASFTFDVLKTKGQRIEYTMLPATNLEKYLSRLFLAIIVWPVAALVTFVAADLVRMLTFPLLGHSFPSLLPYFAGYVADGASYFWSILSCRGYSHDDALLLWFCILFFFSVHGAYLLGSAFFRKQPFILTSVAGIALFVLLNFLMAMFKVDRPLVHSQYGLAVSLSLLIAMEVCFIVFCYWLSYRLFSRVQVIQHKWFNV